MGVPKFFRWAAERYPMIVTPFKNSPPPIDNLYLDMNGIIHHCTHPNDIDATRRAPTEKEMVEAMFSYLEKLFSAVQPRKYFLLAVDGCAPRAKMNQQRQRRYRSGYEMMRAREEALKVGEDVPDEGDVFDSNCITPGTEFMVRLSEQFEYFIAMKIQNDSAWRSCTIIYSGQNHPGEGEHKIVDFIRRRKMQPDYDPNETHCMYGLDADLIMLALATHEPHFCLLREVVTFSRLSKKEEERRVEDMSKGVIEDPTLAKPDSFVLLHVNLFREYLDMDIRRGEDFPNYDMEKMVDDFVLMCFLIGNDFLPSIPTLAINDGSMSTMFNIYRSHILSKGYNLVVNNKPNWAAVEVFLSQLGQLELETLRSRREEELEYQKRMARREDSGAVIVPPVPITNMADFKKRYYSEKLGFGSFDPSSADMAALRKHYIEGISWVFEYYFHGPPSWKWYFPHHYAPLASDLVMLASMGDRVKFDLGEPFLPHMQLLAVLPPMSHRCMPKAYAGLLTSQSSPLRKYFPAQLQIDREGARAPWEGIVLIPFIEERELLAAYQTVQHQVGETERLRNRNGKPVLFKYDPSVVPYDVPSQMFQTLQKITVRRNTFEFPPFPNASGRFVPKLCPGVHLYNTVMEGFPSLSSFVHCGYSLTPVLEPNVVNIFGNTTRKDSIIVHIEENEPIDDASRLAHLVGKSVWVGIPHLKRARVSAIVDRTQRISAKYNDDGTCIGVASQDISNEDYRNFRREVNTHQEMLKAKLGLALADIDVLVFVNRFIGMKLSRRGKFLHVYSNKETCYPIQIVADIATLPVHQDAKNVERDRLSIDAAEGSAKALYIGPDPPNHRGRPMIGSIGVARMSEDQRTFDMAVQYKPFAPEVPSVVLDAVRTDNWLPLGAVCGRVSARLRFAVSPGTITQLASSIITSPAYGSAEIGLCIKFTGKNLARVGYARLAQTQYNAWYVGGGAALFEHMEDNTAEGYYMSNDGGVGGSGASQRQSHHHRSQTDAHNKSGKGVWQFSSRAVDLIVEYCERFTPLVERLETGRSGTQNFDMSCVLRGPWSNRDAGEVLKEITSFVEQTGILKKPMVSASEEAITSEQFAALESAITSTPQPPVQTLHMTHVQQKYIHFPTSTVAEGFSINVPLPKEQKITLISRVVYCRATGNVPFGLAGTVTRLLSDAQTAEVVFDEPFVGGSVLSGRLKSARGALVPLLGLLVIAQPNLNAPKTDDDENAAAGGINVAKVLDQLSSQAALSMPPPRSSATGKANAAAAAAVIASPSAAAPGAAAAAASILSMDTAPALPTSADPVVRVATLREPATTKGPVKVNIGARTFVKFAAPPKEQPIDAVIKKRLAAAISEIFTPVASGRGAAATTNVSKSPAKIKVLKAPSAAAAAASN